MCASFINKKDLVCKVCLGVTADPPVYSAETLSTQDEISVNSDHRDEVQQIIVKQSKYILQSTKIIFSIFRTKDYLMQTNKLHVNNLLSRKKLSLKMKTIGQNS